MNIRAENSKNDILTGLAFLALITVVCVAVWSFGTVYAEVNSVRVIGSLEE